MLLQTTDLSVVWAICIENRYPRNKVISCHSHNFTPEKIISTNVGCTRAVVKPYGVENEINHAKNIYELTIPDTLMPIENPTGHLPRVHRRCFFGGVQYGPFRINPRL